MQPDRLAPPRTGMMGGLIGGIMSHLFFAVPLALLVKARMG